MAVAASHSREQDWARFVYVTRFGSHQCGGVLQLGGRRAQGLWGRERRASCHQEKPTEAMAVPGIPGGGELPPGCRPRVPVVPGVAVAASASSSSSQLQASSRRSSTRPVARAGALAGPAGGRDCWAPSCGAREVGGGFPVRRCCQLARGEGEAL
ncbi:hypothetical protein AAY473_024994 [Plecturocebus cupreus]